MSELIFEVTEEVDGGYCAECLTEAIFTQADSWEKLRENARDAVNTFWFDDPRSVNIRLRLVRDEMLAAG